MAKTYEFSSSLGSDNHSGIHPRILQALIETNVSHAPSYGQDPLTTSCEKILKQTFGENSEAFLVFNGTAANVAGLRALIQSYQAVICSDQSHLHLDECGAPEKHLGVKLLTIPSQDGKITPAQIKNLLVRRGDQHHVQPGVVSITQPTELGVCYSLKELQDLRRFTRENGLKLHMDGARLANAAHFLKVDLIELTQGIGLDALSFGGTKNGMLGAECIVFWDQNYASDFKFHRKQLMQLPSKMRFLSAQFLTYLENGLFKEISEHVHSMATHLRQGLSSIPEAEILHPTESNAVFVKFPKDWIKPLKKQMFFYVWDENDWTCRLMTSFDTAKEDLDAFIKCAKNLSAEKKKGALQ